jgi:hypothetical protein
MAPKKDPAYTANMEIVTLDEIKTGECNIVKLESADVEQNSDQKQKTGNASDTVCI